MLYHIEVVKLLLVLSHIHDFELIKTKLRSFLSLRYLLELIKIKDGLMTNESDYILEKMEDKRKSRNNMEKDAFRGDGDDEEFYGIEPIQLEEDGINEKED